MWHEKDLDTLQKRLKKVDDLHYGEEAQLREIIKHTKVKWVTSQ